MDAFGETLSPLSRKSALLMGAGAVALSLAAAAPASASPIYAYQQTLAIPGVSSFSGYDLATIDPSTQLYYLTDRSNNGIDVFSTATNSYVERIGAGSFSGTQGGNNSIAGPNGVTISNVGTGKLLIAGDGPSNLIAFNLDSTGRNVVGSPRTISTVTTTTPTPANRVDGVAYAPGANTILAANNASNPGFVTLLNNATGAVIKSINLNGTGGYPNVGPNGVEATIYNTARNSFFVAVPALNSDSSGNPLGAGGAIELSATDGSLLHTYDFNALGLSGACSPTGLVQGSGAAMFIACSDPTANKSVVLDPTGSGSIRLVNGISGGDQAAYDPTTNTYFEAARYQPPGGLAGTTPVLGIIDATTLALQTIAIGGNDHSVAVDPNTGEAYVATGPTTAFANCAGGCIGVLGPVSASVPEPGTLPILAMGLMGLGLAVRYRRG